MQVFHLSISKRSPAIAHEGGHILQWWCSEYLRPQQALCGLTDDGQLDCRAFDIVWSDCSVSGLQHIEQFIDWC